MQGEMHRAVQPDWRLANGVPREWFLSGRTRRRPPAAMAGRTGGNWLPPCVRVNVFVAGNTLHG